MVFTKSFFFKKGSHKKKQAACGVIDCDSLIHFFFISDLTMLEPIDPEPPVTSIFFL